MHKISYIDIILYFIISMSFYYIEITSTRNSAILVGNSSFSRVTVCFKNKICPLFRPSIEYIISIVFMAEYFIA